MTRAVLETPAASARIATKALLLPATIGVLLGASPRPAAAQAFAIDFSWQGIARCTDRSPEIRLSGVPAGTRTLDVQMVDLDVPSFKHGGSAVAYDGEAAIRAGAVRYVGPCPPGQRHQYRITVTARDPGGKTLGAASMTHEFPPP